MLFPIGMLIGLVDIKIPLIRDNKVGTNVKNSNLSNHLPIHVCHGFRIYLWAIFQVTICSNVWSILYLRTEIFVCVMKHTDSSLNTQLTNICVICGIILKVRVLVVVTEAVTGN